MPERKPGRDFYFSRSFSYFSFFFYFENREIFESKPRDMLVFCFLQLFFASLFVICLFVCDILLCCFAMLYSPLLFASSICFLLLVSAFYITLFLLHANNVTSHTHNCSLRSFLVYKAIYYFMAVPNTLSLSLSVFISFSRFIHCVLHCHKFYNHISVIVSGSYPFKMFLSSIGSLYAFLPHIWFYTYWKYHVCVCVCTSLFLCRIFCVIPFTKWGEMVFSWGREMVRVGNETNIYSTLRSQAWASNREKIFSIPFQPILSFCVYTIVVCFLLYIFRSSNQKWKYIQTFLANRCEWVCLYRVRRCEMNLFIFLSC